MNLTVKVLPVTTGDSIIVSYEDSNSLRHNIVIDSGLKGSYRKVLKKAVLSLGHIDLFVITHIDRDHIGGILKYIEEVKHERVPDIIGSYWFNSNVVISNMCCSEYCLKDEIEISDYSNNLSVSEGITLEEYLRETDKGNKVPIYFKIDTKDIVGVNTYKLNGAELIVLSPTIEKLMLLQDHWKDEVEEGIEKGLSKEEADYNLSIETLKNRRFISDKSIPNGSSIAFILKDDKDAILLLGDAHIKEVIIALKKLNYSNKNKLNVKYTKLSHHGSKGNIQEDLLEIVNCENFIVSTNGYNTSNLPHKEALVRIICSPYRQKEKRINFYFNYNNRVLNSIFTKEEEKKYNFKCFYPEKQKILTLPWSEI